MLLCWFVWVLAFFADFPLLLHSLHLIKHTISWPKFQREQQQQQQQKTRNVKNKTDTEWELNKIASDIEFSVFLASFFCSNYFILTFKTKYVFELFVRVYRIDVVFIHSSSFNFNIDVYSMRAQ